VLRPLRGIGRWLCEWLSETVGFAPRKRCTFGVWRSCVLSLYGETAPVCEGGVRVFVAAIGDRINFLRLNSLCAMLLPLHLSVVCVVVRTFESHAAPSTAIEFHPTTSLLASACSKEGVVKLWDVRSKSCVQEFSEEVHRFRFSPHGKWILTSDTSGVLQVRDVATRSLIGQVDCKTGSQGGLSQMEFHPKELLVAASTAHGDVKVRRTLALVSALLLREHEVL
jgi:WD40 repeat protein